MVFGLFGSRKKNNLSDLVKDFAAHQDVLARLGKAESLRKLGRFEEADKMLNETEQITTTYLKENPEKKLAYVTAAVFYKETQSFERAVKLIDLLLTRPEFELSEADRLILEGERQNMQRNRPAEERSDDDPEGFTQIYCCQKCGRLHNYVSMPCPNCRWSPQTREEAAHSIILSNAHFKVPALLMLTREMAKGRTATEIVPNLIKDGETYLSNPEQAEVVNQVLRLLRDNEHKNYQDINMLRECANCGSRILISDSDECQECNEAIVWPDAIRALACMDNILWLFEQRIEPTSTEEFSEFVCLLVLMTNNLLRKQATPSRSHRNYALRLLSDMRYLADLNQGALVETRDPHNLQVTLVRESMLEDSETFGVFLFKELESFVVTIDQGIKI